jgi:hypothetical protein
VNIYILATEVGKQDYDYVIIEFNHLCARSYAYSISIKKRKRKKDMHIYNIN